MDIYNPMHNLTDGVNRQLQNIDAKIPWPIAPILRSVIYICAAEAIALIGIAYHSTVAAGKSAQLAINVLLLPIGEEVRWREIYQTNVVCLGRALEMAVVSPFGITHDYKEYMLHYGSSKVFPRPVMKKTMIERINLFQKQHTLGLSIVGAVAITGTLFVAFRDQIFTDENSKTLQSVMNVGGKIILGILKAMAEELPHADF